MSEKPGRERRWLLSAVRWLFAVTVASLMAGAIGAPRLDALAALTAIPGWVAADKAAAIVFAVPVIACIILSSNKMTGNIVKIVNAVRAHRPPPGGEREPDRPRWWRARRRTEQP